MCMCVCLPYIRRACESVTYLQSGQSYRAYIRRACESVAYPTIEIPSYTTWRGRREATPVTTQVSA